MAGINALLAVTQLKVDNANDNAMGAPKRLAGGDPRLNGPLYSSAGSHVKSDHDAQLNALERQLSDLKNEDKPGDFLKTVAGFLFGTDTGLVNSYNRVATTTSGIELKQGKPGPPLKVATPA